MPCSYNSYACPFEFSDIELEGRDICFLHAPVQEHELRGTARTSVFQEWLDNRLARFRKSGRSLIFAGVSIPFGVQFGDRALPKINFLRSRFYGGHHFDNATFADDVRFDDCRFYADTSFETTEFHASLHMSAVLVESSLAFHGTIFNGDVTLTFVDEESKTRKIELFGVRAAAALNLHTKVGHMIHITGSSIDQLSLQGSSGHVIIANSDLTKVALFRGEINGSLQLNSIPKCGGVFGRDLKVGGFVHIKKVVVDESMDFTNAWFRDDISLTECDIHNYLLFSTASTDKDQRSLRRAKFVGTIFRKRPSFTNRIFLAGADFTGCVFEEAPDFHGGELHQDSRFPDLAAFRELNSRDAAAAYRTLRQAMEKNSARREEAMFYALEQRTYRNIPNAQPWWENRASQFYDWISDYGVNFWKPLRILLAVWILSSVIYALGFSFPPRWPLSFDIDNLLNGIGFSMQQIVNPFWAWRMSSKELPLQDYALLSRFIATLQSLTTTGLFAVFLLALRWKFKRD